MDFRLVTTYTPFMVALVRSAGLALLCEASVRWLGARQNVLSVVLALVYCDAYAWRSDKLNRAVGFLCPVGLALLATTSVTPCSGEESDDKNGHSLLALLPYWTVQVAWPLGSAYYLAASAFGVFRPSERQVVGVSAACLAVHCVLLLAGRQGTGDVMLRAAVYYMTSMLFYHAKARLSSVDRNAHSRLTVHVCLHLLFVDLYVLVASVAVFGLLFWKVFLRGGGPGHAGLGLGQPGPGAAKTLSSQPPSSSSKAVPEDVLQQLRAAQALRQA